MRGCLFVLVAAAAVVITAGWFGAPVLASTVVDGMLHSSGFTASRSSVAVDASPPLLILLGHADTVRIDADGVAWQTFHAASLDLTLGNVDLLDRRAATIEGSIGGVELRTGESSTLQPPTADIAVAGSTSDASATNEIPAAAVDRIVLAAFEQALGFAIGSTSLASPDIVRLTTPLGEIEGRLSIDTAGTLILTTPVGPRTILAFDPASPLHLTSVVSTPTGLRLDGRLDVTELLGG